MKHRIEEWKRLEKCGSPKAAEFLKRITAEAKAEGKLNEMNEVAEYLLHSASQRMDAVERGMEKYSIHREMGALSEVINLAYIARHYFGKTRQWLYQRLKGQTVNGKPASFTPEEEALFIGALKDIGLQISSFTHRVL